MIEKNAGYGDNFEYLEDTCRFLSALADVRITEVEDQESAQAGIDDDGEASESDCDTLRNRLLTIQSGLEKKVEATFDLGEVELPLEAIGRELNLSGTEKNILALLACCSPAIALESRITELSESRGVDVKMVHDLFSDSVRERVAVRRMFSPDGKLISRGLLQMKRNNAKQSEQAFLRNELELSSRILSRIIGEDVENEILAPYIEPLEPTVGIDDLILPTELKESALNLIRNRESHFRLWKEWGFEEVRSFAGNTVLMFIGPEGSGRKTLAAALAGEVGRKCLHVRMDRILDKNSSSEEICREIFIEAQYQNAIPLISGADELFCDRNTDELAVFRKSLKAFQGITIMTAGKQQNIGEVFDNFLIQKIEFPLPEAEQREKLWKRLLPEGIPLADDVNIRKIAGDFEMTAGCIQKTIIDASMASFVRESQNITHDNLVCSANSQLKIHATERGRGRGRRIPFMRSDKDEENDLFDTSRGSVLMKDVILPGDVERQVQDIIKAAEQQTRVFDEWGFASGTGSGRSISVLFQGESGTGKTLTAEAVASELNRKLCTVRGSSIISKWLGESDKQIVRVFREADENVVIFFDEADSIFTSRIEMDDSHSDTINRRVSCLLREIEMFSGVVILATNYPGLIDTAFERRIRFKVSFPKPGSKAREAIWRVNIPDGAPVSDDVDFAELGEEYEFTGGQIQSVILRAAFTAASRGMSLNRELLRLAADDEKPFLRKGSIGFSNIAGKEGSA